jgi:superfamily II DNA/RNA helicase
MPSLALEELTRDIKAMLARLKGRSRDGFGAADRLILDAAHAELVRMEEECSFCQLGQEESELAPRLNKQLTSLRAQVGDLLDQLPPIRSITVSRNHVEERISVTPGSRFLVYRHERGLLEDLENGDLYQTDHILAQEMVVVLTPASAARPLWQFVPESLPEAIHRQAAGYWSMRVALAGEKGELAEVIDGLTAEQAREVFLTQSPSVLMERTERNWARDVADQLGQMVLASFREELEGNGIDLAEVPAPEGAPCEWPRTRCITPEPATSSGWKVSVRSSRLLTERLRRALENQGWTSFWLHQALALREITASQRQDHDVVLSTPTASGKTLAFLPAIFLDRERHGGNALFLYPLRALCLDQVKKIRGLLRALDRPDDDLLAFYDQAELPGDVPSFVAATPDKINVHLDKPRLRAFLAGLRWIVIDEAHFYKGCFGIHVALLLRRLLHLAGGKPRLVISSATLENTVAFAQQLTGRQRFRVISASGAPRQARYYYLSGSGCKREVLNSLVYRVQDSQEKGLVFVRSRLETQRQATSLGRGVDRDLVFPFFSGVADYQERLKRLGKEGAAVAVSTSSLEAGIDIGDVTYLAICGFPRSRSSFLQMAGRAGRKGPGHVVFVPDGEDPATDYYREEDAFRELIASSAEPIYLHPHNPKLIEMHLERLLYEAGPSPGVNLLDVFLPKDAPAEIRRPLEEKLMGMLTRPIGRVDAPSLRSIPGDIHAILEVGQPHGPTPPLPEAAQAEAERGNYFIETAIQENARREWAPFSIMTRNGRYYRVETWQKGHWVEGDQEKGRRQPAVLIWARDITDSLIRAEDYRSALAGRQQLPEGREVEHYHQAVLQATGDIRQSTGSNSVGPLLVIAGRGPVNVAVTPFRLRWQLHADFVCPVWWAGRKKSGGKFTPDGVEFILAGEPVALPEEVARNAFEGTGSFSARVGGSERHFRIRERRLLERGSERRLEIQLEEHAFHPSRTDPCSCGAALEGQFSWGCQSEEAPPAWWSHPVYLPDRIFETDLAKFHFPAATNEALVGLAYALVKVLPEVMWLDPGDVGASLVLEMGRLCLLLYDTLDGGSGICTRIPAKLPDLLRAAERLLDRCQRCRCGGSGCFGCIVPFEPPSWPRRFDKDEPPEPDVPPAPAAALAVLASLREAPTAEEEQP